MRTGASHAELERRDEGPPRTRGDGHAAGVQRPVFKIQTRDGVRPAGGPPVRVRERGEGPGEGFVLGRIGFLGLREAAGIRTVPVAGSCRGRVRRPHACGVPAAARRNRPRRIPPKVCEIRRLTHGGAILFKKTKCLENTPCNPRDLVSINRIPNEPTRRRPGTDLARLLAELASLRAGLAEMGALLAKQDAALAERAKEILGLQNTMDAR